MGGITDPSGKSPVSQGPCGGQAPRRRTRTGSTTSPVMHGLQAQLCSPESLTGESFVSTTCTKSKIFLLCLLERYEILFHQLRMFLFILLKTE